MSQRFSFRVVRAEVLQDQVQPRPYDDVQLAMLREMGTPIEELYAEFDHNAAA